MEDEKDKETVFTLESTAKGASQWYTFVSNTPKFAFGFSGWEPSGKWVDDVDEFEAYAREVRKEAGIEDPPAKKKWIPNEPRSGVLWKGTISMPSPRFHSMLTNITVDIGDTNEHNGSDNGSDE